MDNYAQLSNPLQIQAATLYASNNHLPTDGKIFHAVFMEMVKAYSGYMRMRIFGELSKEAFEERYNQHEKALKTGCGHLY